MTLKTVFAGSPDFAATVLRKLADSPFAPSAVITQPDKPKGRGKKMLPSSVKECAIDLGLPLFQPASMKTKESAAELKSMQADVLIVVAYGQILPQKVLDIPRLGCLNVHASLLPRWRGAAPIERAVIAGDTSTGVAIMQMEAGLDTGPVFATATTEIETLGESTCAELTHKLALMGAETLIETLQLLEAKNTFTPTPQSDVGVTYANKLVAADRVIDWHTDAHAAQRQIWALRDRLPVRSQVGGQAIQILSAEVVEQSAANETAPGTILDVSKRGIVVQCATNLLRITSLRFEKGKGTELTIAQALNGHRDAFTPGHMFTEIPG